MRKCLLGMKEIRFLLSSRQAREHQPTMKCGGSSPKKALAKLHALAWGLLPTHRGLRAALAVRWRTRFFALQQLTFFTESRSCTPLPLVHGRQNLEARGIVRDGGKLNSVVTLLALLALHIPPFAAPSLYGALKELVARVCCAFC